MNSISRRIFLEEASEFVKEYKNQK